MCNTSCILPWKIDKEKNKKFIESKSGYRLEVEKKVATALRLGLPDFELPPSLKKNFLSKFQFQELAVSNYGKLLEELDLKFCNSTLTPWMFTSLQYSFGMWSYKWKIGLSLNFFLNPPLKRREIDDYYIPMLRMIEFGLPEYLDDFLFCCSNSFCLEI